MIRLCVLIISEAQAAEANVAATPILTSATAALLVQREEGGALGGDSAEEDYLPWCRRTVGLGGG